MKIRTNKLIGVALAFALGPSGATADPVSFNGHSYEVVVYGALDDKSWDLAKAAAEGMSIAGVSGHLATITSFEEDDFLETLRQATPGIAPVGQFANSELWVGGSQALGALEPGGGWTWVNDEGPIPTFQFNQCANDLMPSPCHPPFSSNSASNFKNL